MTILSIRTVGDPVLRSECEPITVFDRELAKLIDDMLDTMYDLPSLDGLKKVVVNEQTINDGKAPELIYA